MTTQIDRGHTTGYVAFAPEAKQVDSKRGHYSDDLDFQEALIEYVASLNDAHALIAFPTTYFASLGFTVDTLPTGRSPR